MIPQQTTNPKTPRPKLALVHTRPVGGKRYELPNDWELSLAAWLGWLRLSGLSAATLQLRRDHVRSIARRSKTQHPRDLTRGHLQLLCTEHKWSKEHRKALRCSLNSFYEWCLGEALVADNIALCLPKVRPTAPQPRPAPDRIWNELLAAAAPREALMARLAAEAGLRRAEVAVVAIDDLIEDLTGFSLLVHGKGDRQRIVPLTNRLATAIRAQCTHGYLFPGQIDGHISAHYVGELISALMPPGWSMHKLRHRFATRGFAGTGNLRAVQEALGHASVATTERYTLVSRHDVRSVSEAAGAMVTSSGTADPAGE